jgi:hypothetical protein
VGSFATKNGNTKNIIMDWIGCVERANQLACKLVKRVYQGNHHENKITRREEKTTDKILSILDRGGIGKEVLESVPTKVNSGFESRL